MPRGLALAREKEREIGRRRDKVKERRGRKDRKKGGKR
jgi:hypothetical protein